MLVLSFAGIFSLSHARAIVESGSSTFVEGGRERERERIDGIYSRGLPIAQVSVVFLFNQS